MDDAPFVFGDRTERAAAKAAAHDRHRESDHLPRWYLRIAVRRMRSARIGKFVHGIHLGRGDGDRWRCHPKFAVAVLLHQGTRVAGVALAVQNAAGAGVSFGIFLDLFKGRQAHDDFFAAFLVGLFGPFVGRFDVIGARFGPAIGNGGLQQRDAPHVVHLGGFLAFCKTVGDFHHRTFGVAVEQDVGL